MPLELRSDIHVKIGGNDAPEAFDHNIIEVAVDSNTRMPDMFTIEVFDDDLKWVDDSRLIDLGKEVQITFDPPQQGGAPGTPLVLIDKGEITALEPSFNENSRATLIIRGYDKSHRLHRGKKTRTFAKAKDSALAGKLAKEADLTLVADQTSIEYDYVLQNNQTNMEFLRDRAARIGYQVFTEEGKLYFKKGDFKLGEGPELEWGKNLISFRPRLTGVQQADTGIVTGWDPKTKKQILGKATAPSPSAQGGVTQSGGAAAKKAFGGPAEIAVNQRPVATVDEAKAMATSLVQEVNAEFMQAEGECFGDPRIKAGRTVKISKVGQRFSGKYLVTSAVHIYRSGKYRTTFTTGWQEAYTISTLVGGSSNGRTGEHPAAMPGVAIGVVTNQKDPDKLGRVKVMFPWMQKDKGADIESHWVRVAAPMAGKERGFFFLPEVNDEVLVAFEHGDPQHPYIVGSLWNSKDTPPLTNDKAAKDGKTDQRIIKTRSGHVILLDDTKDKEQIVIRDKTTKNEIIINSKDNTLLINLQKDIKITAKGKMFFTAKDDIVMEGKNVLITSKMSTKVSAKQNIELDATAQLKASGKAGAELKNAAAGIKLTGPIVNINNGALEVM
jgi:phage protein D